MTHVLEILLQNFTGDVRKLDGREFRNFYDERFVLGPRVAHKVNFFLTNVMNLSKKFLRIKQEIFFELFIKWY
jgi:hypothetical protein